MCNQISFKKIKHFNSFKPFLNLFTINLLSFPRVKKVFNDFIRTKRRLFLRYDGVKKTLLLGFFDNTFFNCQMLIEKRTCFFPSFLIFCVCLKLRHRPFKSLKILWKNYLFFCGCTFVGAPCKDNKKFNY